MPKHSQPALPPTSHDKPCTLCGTPRPVLVRCQVDATGTWHFVCPGHCWRSVSGGVEDARGHEAEFPHYRYGGMWKNKHADGPVSAKKPRKVKQRQRAHKAQVEERRSSDDGDAGNDVLGSDGETEHGMKKAEKATETGIDGQDV